MKETILLTDGYKLGHHLQYPKGTEAQEVCGYLETIFKDGQLLKEYTLAEIRERINKSL